MNRTLASLALLCGFIAGCATEPGATGATQEEAYTPTGSNIPRRAAPKPAQPAVTSGAQPAAKPAQ
jgi:hypothetical protein